MTAEGVFPKVDGDILYASETNRFAKAPQYLAMGSTTVVGSQTGITVDFGNSSPTNYTNVGSVYVSGTSNPCILNIEFFTPSKTDSSETVIALSGTQERFMLTKNGSPAIYLQGTAKVFLGSPFECASNVTMYRTDTDANDDIEGTTVGGVPLKYFHSRHKRSNFDCGSPFVVFFGVTKNVGNISYTYSVQEIRGTY